MRIVTSLIGALILTLSTAAWAGGPRTPIEAWQRLRDGDSAARAARARRALGKRRPLLRPASRVDLVRSTMPRPAPTKSKAKATSRSARQQRRAAAPSTFLGRLMSHLRGLFR